MHSCDLRGVVNEFGLVTGKFGDYKLESHQHPVQPAPTQDFFTTNGRMKVSRT